MHHDLAFFPPGLSLGFSGSRLEIKEGESGSAEVAILSPNVVDVEIELQVTGSNGRCRVGLIPDAFKCTCDYFIIVDITFFIIERKLL